MNFSEMNIQGSDLSPSMAYTYVGSRDSVRIVLLITALNGLDLQCSDVQNSYLNTNPNECVYFYSDK